MKRVLIRGGEVTTAVDRWRGDILIEDGRIAALGAALSADAEIHEAAGLLVLPGGVDVHTHIDYDTGSARTADTFETATRAAAFGGTTTIVDYAFQPRDVPSVAAAFDDWLGRAATACVDVGAHMILTAVTPATLAETRRLVRHGGVTSVKLFMAYPDTLMVDDGALWRVMRQVGDDGGLVCLHAENGPLIQALVEEALAAGHTAPRWHAATRPSCAEGEAVDRAVAVSELAGAPVYLVHLSTREGVEAVARARDRNLPVWAETCPHYLFLDESAYDTDDVEAAAKVVFTPPLRGLEHQRALWRGLATGDLQVISTDHCPFCISETTLTPYHAKRAAEACDFTRIPNGAPGIETRMPLLFDAAVAGRRMDLHRFVALTATNPAKLFGLFPRKGAIAVGSDADLVLFDPDATTTVRASEHHSRVDYSLFEGWSLRGAIRKVFSRGELIVDGAIWRGRAGAGRFLRREASGGL
ncbi:dihydropyrimidinase [Roseiarcus fermentans]|uniref:Dihydropyrimidinase n=1 Tax=Roseiarcus fermentans TaxID=1473586 RepID=A0A366F1Z4_9HYPH|nr:dihydropyrimidinase [Roseiarcus fermentans]RBP08692.1 dihydropyrimidinase [Roseiarcus fermentans]